MRQVVTPLRSKHATNRQGQVRQRIPALLAAGGEVQVKGPDGIFGTHRFVSRLGLSRPVDLER